MSEIEGAPRVESSVTSRRFSRFVALDQVRGLAIFCMVFAHFGPAVYERLGLHGLPRDILDFVGRMATPGFILIFGITLAIVYIPKTLVNPAVGRVLLLKRAILVLGCCLLVALPSTLRFFISGDAFTTDHFVFELLLRQYNVLTFYALAIAVTGLAIGWIAQNPVRNGIICGAILIFIGSCLGYDAWGPRPQELIELVRLLLVSGKYGTFVLMGCAWMIIAVGELIHRTLISGGNFHAPVMTISIGLGLTALSDGRIIGWRTLHDLHSGYYAPPQFWYMAMIAGLMLATLVFFDRYRLPVVGFLLEHIGRSPLSIYVAHTFVIPASELLRTMLPHIPETLIDVTCMGVFLAFCAYRVRQSAQKNSTLAVRAPLAPS